MTIKSNLESALDSVSKALIIALEEQNEDQVTKLFELYNKVRTSIPKDSPVFSINFDDTAYSPVAAGAVDWTRFGSFGDDVISFGDTVISGSGGTDTISLG